MTTIAKVAVAGAVLAVLGGFLLGRSVAGQAPLPDVGGPVNVGSTATPSSGAPTLRPRERDGDRRGQGPRDDRGGDDRGGDNPRGDDRDDRRGDNSGPGSAGDDNSGPDDDDSGQGRGRGRGRGGDDDIRTVGPSPSVVSPDDDDDGDNSGSGGDDGGDDD